MIRRPHGKIVWFELDRLVDQTPAPTDGAQRIVEDDPPRVVRPGGRDSGGGDACGGDAGPGDERVAGTDGSSGQATLRRFRFVA
jgi:hypothetical protein